MVGFKVCPEPVGGMASKWAGMNISKWSSNAKEGYIINYIKELPRNSRTLQKKNNSSSLRHCSKQTHTSVSLPAVVNPPLPCSPRAVGIFIPSSHSASAVSSTHHLVTEPLTASAAKRWFRAWQQNNLWGPSEPERRHCLASKKNTQSWEGYGKIC